MKLEKYLMKKKRFFFSIDAPLNWFVLDYLIGIEIQFQNQIPYKMKMENKFLCGALHRSNEFLALFSCNEERFRSKIDIFFGQISLLNEILNMHSMD